MCGLMHSLFIYLLKDFSATGGINLQYIRQEMGRERKGEEMEERSQGQESNLVRLHRGLTASINGAAALPLHHPLLVIF